MCFVRTLFSFLSPDKDIDFNGFMENANEKSAQVFKITNYFAGLCSISYIISAIVSLIYSYFKWGYANYESLYHPVSLSYVMFHHLDMIFLKIATFDFSIVADCPGINVVYWIGLPKEFLMFLQ